MRTADQPIRLSLFAPDGRMGQAIAKAVGDDPAFAIDQEHGDVLVDFSAPDALRASLDRAVSGGIPILVGTTGLKDEHQQLIDEAAKSIAVLRAPNTSVGVNLLRALVEQAVARLGPEWDIEVLEMHHRKKVDAPSGTALLLAQAAAQARGHNLPDLARFDRFGEPHAREPGTIGFASLRGGSGGGGAVGVLRGRGGRGPRGAPPGPRHRVGPRRR